MYNFCGLGVRDRDRNADEQPQSNKSLLLVTKPVVFVSCGWALKHPCRINEVELVIPKVQLALGFFPRELHLRSVYTVTLERKRNPGRPLTLRMSAAGTHARAW